MKFWLGTHEPGWFGRSTVPLFVSMNRRHKFPRRPRVHAPGWALDSGGFTNVTQHGGWSMSATEFRDTAYQLGDLIMGLRWAAPQDWMCEPVAIEATGLSVAEHQQRTLDNYLELREIDERKLFIPVLQGWLPGDHEHHVEMYEAAGVDLRRERLVGVGSICRRQATNEIAGVIGSLSGYGLRLHGFGVKTKGLAKYRSLLTSCDSLAWSDRARNAALHGEGPLGEGCTHRACNNCFVWAHQWRRNLVI